MFRGFGSPEAISGTPAASLASERLGTYKESSHIVNSEFTTNRQSNLRETIKHHQKLPKIYFFSPCWHILIPVHKCLLNRTPSAFALIVLVFVKRTFGTESMVAMVLRRDLACPALLQMSTGSFRRCSSRLKQITFFPLTFSPLSFVMNPFCMQ